MAEKYLIDTSAVIKYLAVVLPSKGIAFMDKVVDAESNISFITEIELQVWNPPNPNDMLVYIRFISGSNIIFIDASIITQAVSIRKNQKLKIPDAIIAATAIVNDYTLISDNDKDFKKIAGLKYANPALMKG
jgi:tRNA(fMet)-specific endonuclease VapC